MNKHKHYQAIRAFADGWVVERWDNEYKHWCLTTFPNFGNQNALFNIVPDAEGWLPWYGGECPVGLNDFIMCEFRKGNRTDVARSFCWTDETENPIIRYRSIKVEPKPKVKMWQWVLEGADKNIVFTTNFYRSEEEVRKEYTGCKIIQRADWTEIEVEES